MGMRMYHHANAALRVTDFTSLTILIAESRPMMAPASDDSVPISASAGWMSAAMTLPTIDPPTMMMTGSRNVISALRLDGPGPVPAEGIVPISAPGPGIMG